MSPLAHFRCAAATTKVLQAQGPYFKQKVQLLNLILRFNSQGGSSLGRLGVDGACLDDIESFAIRLGAAGDRGKGVRMMSVRWTVLVLATLMSLGGFVRCASAESSEATQKAMQAAGQIMFEHRCRVCHSDDADGKGYGPDLRGVLGRKAGSIEGFNYSDALKNSGLVWNEASLRAWIENNNEVLPGTRMRHVGITDRAEQDFLIEYLKSLH